MKRIITTIPRSFLNVRNTFRAEYPVERKTKEYNGIFDMLLGVVAGLFIIVSVIAYEKSFSVNRTHSNCEINDILGYQFVLAGFYLISLAVLGWRFIELKPKIITQEYLLTYLAEAVILSIFSYPYSEANIYIQQASIKTSITGKSINNTICYKFSEVLYTLTFLRVYFVIKLFRRFLEIKSKKDTNSHFSLDVSEERIRKKLFLTFCFLSTILLLIAGEILRVSERPYSDISLFNFDSYLNAMWCLATSMTSVGYGDFYPTTMIGRAVCFFSAALGAVIFGIVIYGISSYILITKKEIKVLNAIENTRDSGQIIKYAIILNYYLKNYGKSDATTQKYILKLSNSLKSRKRSEVIKTHPNKKGSDKYLMNIIGRIETRLESVSYRIN